MLYKSFPPAPIAVESVGSQSTAASILPAMNAGPASLSEVVALALESQGFVREGAAKKAAPENEAPAAEKELKEELAAARSQNAALKQELDGAKDQLEVALKENATLKQELDGTKDQLEVALKQNQETAEKSQTARKK